MNLDKVQPQLARLLRSFKWARMDEIFFPRAKRSVMNLLFLCHRFPFPPDKGEKIRAYHMLVHLAQQHTVHLGAFVEDHTEMRHQADCGR